MDTEQPIIKQLLRDEGLLLKPYQDSVGKWTIGIGRNLSDVGITESEAYGLLHNDLEKVAKQLKEELPWLDSLSVERRAVLGNMCFNLGIAGLMQFKKFLTALRLGNYEHAAIEMLDSKWAKQVGPRAVRLAAQIRTGVWQ